MSDIEQAAMKLSGIKPKLVHKTLFIALPAALQRPIEGGCQCRICKAQPDKTPMWDTLAIAANGEGHTWIVHYPELSAPVAPREMEALRQGYTHT